MRKRLISPIRSTGAVPERGWLELDQTAVVEVSSEAEGYPVEEALLRDGRGWRADSPGVQTIRLLFDRPQTIHLIRLVFKEEALTRTQEFVLRWLPYGGGSWKDIVRQQWNFSPPNTVEECEEYEFDLSSAAALELSINPDISQGEARSSLQRLQLAVRP
ncbi:MAG TPA: hypothetical protein VFB04_12765 [Terriglobales bacterium]|nr:hypothetical protein [Terriglobales bacterium]